ncbi:cytidylyltransferase domain-containing protein [Winogradskyella aurantiaca]|uniref:cytidylyltransferase domain-containing protein n=1 Tax=Winogradskyella aurantiaca TaxID=2219558 RepID=UPI000E1E1E4F|nr:acylneuraminate cytidylyltransferase [Winogradskyella aurantiaca]
MKKLLIIIPARGGSKGIPRKNLRTLNGKPLIYYSIKNSNFSDKYKIDCYVSTDDQEIELISKKFGASVIRRTGDLSNDIATLDPVIYYSFKKIKRKSSNIDYDAVITIQPTSPLLSPDSIEMAVDNFFSNNLDTLISGIDERHLTWKKINNRYVPNYKERLNRQQLPKVYKETGGFVITKPEFITINSRFGPKVEIFPLSKKESIDIDDFDDWNLCEYYIKRKTILFVVSGYSEIGMGHVYNTLSIANEILNHRVVFLVTKKSQLAYDKISESNYEVHLQKEDDIIDDILKYKPDAVINDILDTERSYIIKLKSNSIKCINFEDLGEGAELADLVINAMYPENKISLNHYYGSNYFILRDEFLFTKKITIKENIENILISFGGVDPNNYTERVLDLLCSKFDKSYNISVVTGLGYNGFRRLQKKHPNIDIKVNINNISDEFKNSDLIFTSAGRTTFEAASLGVPCIVLCQNRRETTHFFASEKNGFYNLGLGYESSDSKILMAFNKVTDLKLRQLMHQRMLSNSIKMGKRRVVKLINEVL